MLDCCPFCVSHSPRLASPFAHLSNQPSAIVKHCRTLKSPRSALTYRPTGRPPDRPDRQTDARTHENQSIRHSQHTHTHTLHPLCLQTWIHPPPHPHLPLEHPPSRFVLLRSRLSTVVSSSPLSDRILDFRTASHGFISTSHSVGRCLSRATTNTSLRTHQHSAASILRCSRPHIALSASPPPLCVKEPHLQSSTHDDRIALALRYPVHPSPLSFP